MQRRGGNDDGLQRWSAAVLAGWMLSVFQPPPQPWAPTWSAFSLHTVLSIVLRPYSALADEGNLASGADIPI
jgi:hypothetical protein